MSYLKELQNHYKGVRARIAAAAVARPKPLLLPMPALLNVGQPPEPRRAGLVPEKAEKAIVTEALRQANPNWTGGSQAQAVRIAEDIMGCPKLPPLPGLNLNEDGHTRWMRVLHAVAVHHELKPAEILSSSRKRHIVKARMELFYRLRVDLGYSYTKIACYVKRDHTTVLHAVHKVRDELLDELKKAGDDVGSPVGNHLTAGGNTQISLSPSP